MHTAADDRQLAARIVWYVHHKNDILAHHDRFLADIDVTRLPTMPRRTKREWLRHLDRAQEAYRIENTQKAKGQHTIFDFFHAMADPGSDAIT